MKKLLACALCVLMLLGTLAACNGNNSKNQNNNNQDQQNNQNEQNQPSEPSGSGEDDAEPVTIKVFSNLTDRTSGQGLIEQMLFDNYMAEHKNVTIEVEALDDESYQTKFKAYASGSGMPDLVNIWCMPSFLDEVVAAGKMAPLNIDDYADYGFAEGSLSGVTYDGQLYGLPRNTDVLGFYYNKDMFAEHNQTLSDAGISPIALDGQDGWVINHFINCLSGTILTDRTYEVMLSSVKNQDYSDPSWTTAVSAVADNASLLFQPGFGTTDYGTAMNLFVNGQAAMFFMGSWEMSIDNNTDFAVGHFVMPDMDGDGKTVIGAYNGGGYGISADSQIKEEATALLNYMFEPANWSRLCWENGVCMSAQNFMEYLTGNESELQTEIINNYNNASGITGMTYNDLGTSAYKQVCETSTTEVAVGMISVEDYLAGLASVK